MADASTLALQALTLYVLAAGLFGVGSMTPMESFEHHALARLISMLFFLATLLFLFSLLHAAAS